MTTEPTTPATADPDDRPGPVSAPGPAAGLPTEAPALPGDPPPETNDETIRTLLWTAATHRPLEEVAALVTLLKRTNAVRNPGDEALRAAAVARPLEEVRQLVTLLTESGHELGEADTALRAAAVGRPIEDVAQLVSILGTDGADAWPHVPARTVPDNPPTLDGGGAGGAPVPARPAAPPKWPVAGARGVASVLEGALAGSPSGPAAPTILRSGLRWPAALALLVCGFLHLPTDFAHLRSGGWVDTLALAVTVLCLVFGVWLPARDTARVWAAAAATAIGIVAVHALAGAGALDLLSSSLGAAFGWATGVAVVCAAAGAVLSCSALLLRPRQTDPADGT
ncbi:hypothetical protein ACLGI4_26540 [Streptomyces sp. HMX112]|uniref:hypothetical protein n=1 Tax=Streptomyces sp. HMX112 TaxID=3390850 RepID=UPI003A809D54